MPNLANFLEYVSGGAAGLEITPEFMVLYRQSVLLALKEEGVLSEDQCRLCLNTLTDERKES